MRVSPFCGANEGKSLCYLEKDSLETRITYSLQLWMKSQKMAPIGFFFPLEKQDANVTVKPVGMGTPHTPSTSTRLRALFAPNWEGSADSGQPAPTLFCFSQGAYREALAVHRESGWLCP